MRRQCKLLGVSRSSATYEPVAESAENLQIKRLLDEYYMTYPCLGTRRVKTILERENKLIVNRKRLQRLRQEMGIEAIYCKPRTSLADDGHRKYPYLLRNLGGAGIGMSMKFFYFIISLFMMTDGYARPDRLSVVSGELIQGAGGEYGEVG